MKKRLFFTILLSTILVFVFSLCISAQTIIYDEYEEKTALTYDPSELVLFDDGCAYPSYYIFEDSDAFKTNYEWLNQKAVKNYSDASVVELCIPTGVLTGGNFKNDSSASFTSILKLNTGKTLQKTNGDFWTNLTLTHVTFGQGFTNDGLGQWFFNGAKVEYIIFSDNSQITTLPSQFFGGLTTLKGIYFGNSITNIVGGTFQNMGSSNVFLMNTPSDTEPSEVYYFKSILQEGNFYNFKTNAKTNTWVFPSSVNGIGSGWNIDHAENLPINLVFLTSNASDVTINNTIGSTKLTGKSFYFPNISSENANKMTVVPHATFFFGDGKKISYNGAWDAAVDMIGSEHLHDTKNDISTLPTCTKAGLIATHCFCGKSLSSTTIDALGHDFSLKADEKEPKVIDWSYKNNNYFENACPMYCCLDCGADYFGEELDNSFLFYSSGYSIPESAGSNSIAYAITVNKNGFEKYKELTGKTVRYGVVVAVGDALGTPLSIENGDLSVKNQAVFAEMTGSEYTCLKVRLCNLTDGAIFNCCAFAVEGSTISYISDKAVSSSAETKKL